MIPMDAQSPDAARAVLAARARRLARPAAPDVASTEDDLDLLIVQVGEERLGIPMPGIVAVARVERIVPLPRAVRPVYGVTPWRGRPLTVLTLAAQQPAMSDASRLVILGSGSRATLAVVVDAVDDVERVTRGTLSQAGAGPRRRYALGVTAAGLLVIDGDALLHPDGLAP